MRMDKLTSRFQQALADAQSLAVGRDNSIIEPVHLFSALLDQQGGSTRPLLAQAGANIPVLRERLGEAPLMRVEENGKYAMVASKGGAPEHPAWYHNVKAHPQVTVQDGDSVVELTAREVDGDERAHWWELAVAAFPPYGEYQTKTDRQIPVFVLE